MLGLASTPAALYLGIVLTIAGGILAPAIQAVLSGRMPHDQQGLLQGALASLNNLANVLAPPAVAAIFAYVLNRNPNLPIGLPLFACAVVELCALLVAAAALKGHVQPVPSPNPST